MFWLYGMTRPGIEPRFLGPLANTHEAMGRYNFFNVYIYVSILKGVVLVV